MGGGGRLASCHLSLNLLYSLRKMEIILYISEGVVSVK